MCELERYRPSIECRHHIVMTGDVYRKKRADINRERVYPWETSEAIDRAAERKNRTDRSIVGREMKGLASCWDTNCHQIIRKEFGCFVANVIRTGAL